MEATPTFAVEPSNTTALAGTRVMMECAGRGYPHPRVVWIRAPGGGGGLPQGARTHPTTRALVIEGVAPSHAGGYVCLLLDHNFELIAQRKAVLTVQGKYIRSFAESLQQDLF